MKDSNKDLDPLLFNIVRVLLVLLTVYCIVVLVQVYKMKEDEKKLRDATIDTLHSEEYENDIHAIRELASKKAEELGSKVSYIYQDSKELNKFNIGLVNGKSFTIVVSSDDLNVVLDDLSGGEQDEE